MATPKNKLELHEAETSSEEHDERKVYLDDGRQVAIVRTDGREIIELRAASGQVELKIRMTEDGPVLVVDAVKLDVRATESVDIQCKDFKVTATETAVIESAGTVKIKSEHEIEVEGGGDVKVVGQKIYLN